MAFTSLLLAAAAAAAPAAGGPAAAAGHAACGTGRLSVSGDEAQANWFSATTTTAVSTHGRYVAFDSDASNLVPGDTNGSTDVFVRDRATGTTRRVSVSSTGTQASGPSSSPAISSDGRFAAFDSDAPDLVPADTNEARDVFVRDRATGSTRRVSVSSVGTSATGSSFTPSVSADGRYVAFASEASDLAPGDTNGFVDVFVRDRVTAATQRVSVSSSGAQGDFFSSEPAVSANGRFVAFTSSASNLVPGDSNFFTQVFVRDRSRGTTRRVSESSSGVQGDSYSYPPAISADGRYVAFHSHASNLVADDTNGSADVFVWDGATGTIRRVSLSSAGAQASGNSMAPAISGDGRYVAFESDASDLVPDDTNNVFDVFVRDRVARTTRRVSLSSTCVQASTFNGLSYGAAISPDGRYVAYASDASDLVPDDTNSSVDVFGRRIAP